jgi:hypothetical protein
MAMRVRFDAFVVYGSREHSSDVRCAADPGTRSEPDVLHPGLSQPHLGCSGVSVDGVIIMP